MKPCFQKDLSPTHWKPNMLLERSTRFVVVALFRIGQKYLSVRSEPVPFAPVSSGCGMLGMFSEQAAVPGSLLASGAGEGLSVPVEVDYSPWRGTECV